MAEVTCVDGRVLALRPEPVLGRDGVAYEALLHLHLDEVPYAVVGERCRGVLTALRDRGLVGSSEARVRAAGLDWDAVAPYVGRDRELIALRARDPDDLPGGGAVRALLDVRRQWRGGRWLVTEQVLLEAWGEDGTGVRAELSTKAFTGLVEALLSEVEQALVTVRER